MKIKKATVHEAFHQDFMDAGFENQMYYFKIDDSKLRETVDKLLRTACVYPLAVLAREMGIKYTIPDWVSERKLLEALFALWDGNASSLPIGIRCISSRGAVYSDVLSLISGPKSVVFLTYTNPEMSFCRDVEVVNVGGWTVLPNTIVSPSVRSNINNILPQLPAAIHAATEAEGKMWTSEITSERAATMSSKLDEIRKKAADVSRRLMNQAMERFKEQNTEAQNALRKYDARRKEYKELSSMSVSPEVVKEHLEGIRSIPGVDGVLLLGDVLHVRFHAYKMSLVHCTNHVQKRPGKFWTETPCSAGHDRCYGPGVDMCPDGHPMTIGETCPTCGKGFRGIGFKCQYCGKIVKTWGEDAVATIKAECTYCKETRTVEEYTFPAYMAGIRLSRAEDRSVSMKACSPNPNVEQQHPHIQYDGRCCFGSAAGVPTYFLREGKYKQLIRLLVVLLRSYTPNDAYAGINYWRFE